MKDEWFLDFILVILVILMGTATGKVIYIILFGG